MDDPFVSPPREFSGLESSEESRFRVKEEIEARVVGPQADGLYPREADLEHAVLA
jgi:hypothetical protein